MSDESEADSALDSENSGEGEGSTEPPESPKEVISEIQLTLGEHSKYVADHFDTLFAEVELLKKTLAETETELRDETDTKIKAVQDMLIARIEMLEARATENEAKLFDEQSWSKQQESQYDTLQSQVGVLFFRFH